MEKRNLGKTGLEVPPLTIGGNVFGWTLNEPASGAVLDHFAAQGFNFIDTANTYSSWVPGNRGGESETIIGNWISQRGNRTSVLIATKLGSELDGKKGLRKDYVIESVHASLKRLRTDYIDLYQAHYPDPETPIAETLEAFEQLRREGKIRAYGASNYTAAQLQEAVQVSQSQGIEGYTTLQPLYNLYDRAAFEKELEPICRENGIAVINYYALASGFLSGKYRSKEDLSKSKRGQGVSKYLNERGLRILKALDETAAAYHMTPATIALAWLLAKPTVTAPIVSATSTAQIDALVQATTLKLDDAAVAALEKASAP